MAPDAQPEPRPARQPDPSSDSGPDQADDERRLAEIADALADAVDGALPGWVEHCVTRVFVAWRGTGPVPEEVQVAAHQAGLAARREVGAQLRRLLAEDIDAQRTNPLAVLRGAVRYPTGVLRGAGVPDVVRDAFDVAHAPDDVYGLTPASFADIDPVLHEPGLVWGAAKAHVHLRRRRAQGQR